MQQKAIIMDAAAMERSMMRIAHEVLERDGEEDLCIVGIRRRGVPLAQEIARNIARITGKEVPCGTLDITLYRDDLTERGEQASVGSTGIPVDIRGKTVVLVDDVLYTGRTARAAMEAVIRLGRPAAIRLAVLVDRGHRELPVNADFRGKNVPTSRRELIEVRVPEYDGRKEVAILERDD